MGPYYSGPWDPPPELPSERDITIPKDPWLNEPGLESQYPIEEALLGGRLMQPVFGLLGKVVDRVGQRRFLNAAGKFEDLVKTNSRLRAKRMLAQESKWVDQSPDLRQALETATDRIDTPWSNRVGAYFDPSIIERKNIYGNWEPRYSPKTSRAEVPMKKVDDRGRAAARYAGEPRRAAAAARHETGHYYRNSPDEGLEWGRAHDMEMVKKIAKKRRGYDPSYPERLSDYFRGKSQIELRERAAQLKDFIAEKKGIGYDVDFPVTRQDLDWAIDNYLKRRYGNYDNNMKEYLGSIVDRDQLFYNMNRFALGVTPLVGMEANNRKGRFSK